jgi:RecA/RadA recombinase
MSLAERLAKSGAVKTSSILSESNFFNKKDTIKTDLPILNIAFSGDVDGGLVSGLTIFAGESKTYKTLGALYCLKAYLDKYPEGACLLYDSEFGVTPEYLQCNGIDTSRVVHIPIEHIEQLKFDMVKRLEEIQRGDKVFIMVDSIGMVPSIKEVNDALDEKAVADMTRAKALRSWLRIITPQLSTKDLPAIIISHIYQTQEMYSKAVVSGGTAVTYAANTVFIFTKAQEKDANGELAGYNFSININKSRFVKEKSKLTFTVRYDQGIDKYSGLLDIAIDAGIIIKPGKGWYQMLDESTGEMIEPKIRLKDISDEMWENILKSEKFKIHVKKTYQLGQMPPVNNLPYQYDIDDDIVDDN